MTYRPSDVGTPEAWTRYFTLPAPVACGNYLLRAEVLPAGADPLNAGAEGNDQNGWKLRVGRDDDAVPTNTPPANTDDYDGVDGTNDELSIGFVQTTFQHNQSGTSCQTMYESVPPNLASIRFHNFDFDGASTANRVRYYSPSETVDPDALVGRDRRDAVRQHRLERLGDDHARGRPHQQPDAGGVGDRQLHQRQQPVHPGGAGRGHELLHAPDQPGA